MTDIIPPKSDNKKKILIVEDDFFIRDLYQINAESQGLDAVFAVDGQEALDKARAYTPDIILLDLMLPKVDGITVLRTLRAEEQTKNIPVVVITNLEDDTKKKEAEQLGVAEYLLKIDNTPGSVIEKLKKHLPQ